MSLFMSRQKINSYFYFLYILKGLKIMKKDFLVGYLVTTVMLGQLSSLFESIMEFINSLFTKYPLSRISLYLGALVEMVGHMDTINLVPISFSSFTMASGSGPLHGPVKEICHDHIQRNTSPVIFSCYCHQFVLGLIAKLGLPKSQTILRHNRWLPSHCHIF